MIVHPVTEIKEFNVSDSKLKGFKVYEISGVENPPHSQGRRDFYKIVLVTGDMTISYGDQAVEINDTFLFFANPLVPHSVVHHSMVKKGYACLFTEAFIASRQRTEILQNSPLFQVGGRPIIPLNGEQAGFMTGLFEKMLSVHHGDAIFQSFQSTSIY